MVWNLPRSLPAMVRQSLAGFVTGHSPVGDVVLAFLTVPGSRSTCLREWLDSGEKPGPIGFGLT